MTTKQNDNSTDENTASSAERNAASTKAKEFLFINETSRWHNGAAIEAPPNPGTRSSVQKRRHFKRPRSSSAAESHGDAPHHNADVELASARTPLLLRTPKAKKFLTNNSQLPLPDDISSGPRTTLPFAKSSCDLTCDQAGNTASAVSDIPSKLSLALSHDGDHPTTAILSDGNQDDDRTISLSDVSEPKSTNPQKEAELAIATRHEYAVGNQLPTSPQSESNETWSDSLSDSSPAVDNPLQFRAAFQAMTTAFGSADHSVLTPAKIIEVIRIGDACIRRDAHHFMSSHLQPVLAKVWCQDDTGDPTIHNSLAEMGFHSFRCAEVLSARSVIDPLRLQCARLLLYQYAEQLSQDFSRDALMLNGRSRGRDVSSVAIDTILELTYPPQCLGDPQMRMRCRRSLLKHKMVGKRWSIMARHIGTGLLLIFSSTLATAL